MPCRNNIRPMANIADELDDAVVFVSVVLLLLVVGAFCFVSSSVCDMGAGRPVSLTDATTEHTARVVAATKYTAAAAPFGGVCQQLSWL